MKNNNNRQSVKNFVYRKKSNTQSVNNFVYRKNRNNDTQQPIQPTQNNTYDFTDRNTQPQNNNYTSSNNYNSYVSDNDYNSYTSNYQPTNSYNNNLNTNQNDYTNNSFYNGNNNYNNNPQTYQQNIYPNNNMMDTYQDYNTPVNYLDVNSYPVEVPLPNKMKLSVIIILASFFVPFIFGFLAVALPFLQNIVTIPFGLSFFSTFGAIIAAPFIDRYELKKVCTVPVTGQLVGYEQRRTHSKYRYYNIYAPKYKIFINNRYEIRTLDDFTRSSNRPASINLLANPNGYEIMPADGSLSQSGKGSITVVVIMLVIIAFFFILAILFFILRRIIL